MSNSINVIKSGLARCITEPRGRHGLEGYGLGQTTGSSAARMGRGDIAGCIRAGAFQIITRRAARLSSQAIL
jgi:hypothetical protein